MKTVVVDIDRSDTEEYFDPMEGGVTPHCYCGAELIRNDSETWQCSVARIKFRIDESEVIYDKSGKVLLKIPAGHGGKNENN